jgi:hypothetical protein
VDSIRFSALYLACLGFCVGSILGLKANARVAEPRVAKAQIIADFIAIPPKPEGVERPKEGDAPLHSWKGCEKREGDFRDACFKALAWQRAERDVEGALKACEQVKDQDQAFECIADVAELHTRTDRQRAEAICPSIPKKKWKDQCWFGIGLAWSIHDTEYARATCENAGMWRDFCRHDVNGEIAQVDALDALNWCNKEEGSPLQRKTCFHGLGKYLGRSQPEEAIAICEVVPSNNPLYAENCFHGLGWAVAEKQGDAESIAFCSALRRNQDSCFLGLSAHAKRLSPVQSLALCERVEREDLRDRCEGFAKRKAP